MTLDTKSLILGLPALGLLLYGIILIVGSLATGRKWIALRYQPTFEITRQNNTLAFWFYLAVDLVFCVIAGAFAYHFLSGLA